MKNFEFDLFTLFKGIIFHKRYAIKEYLFKNSSLFLGINLSQLANKNLEMKRNTPIFFSVNKFNVLSWHVEDHGNRQKNSSILNLLNFLKKLSNKNHQTIILFTFPRIFGFGFNPLSLYFCFDKKGLNQTIFEVKNTFGDIHHYILNNVKKYGLKQKIEKKLFVSPFFENKGLYKLFSNIKDNKVIIDIEYIVDRVISLNANLKAKKIPFTNLEILKNLITLKSFPGKIWLNIHYHALKLWIKKISFYKTPKEKKIKYNKAKIIN